MTIIQGDALTELKKLPTHSVDAICTDPPAGIAFMGKDWDKNKGGRDVWITWLAEILTEARRVIRPGGHILVWSLPRTSHWTGMAIENAGFEVKDTIEHLFGSGFPKSHNVSVAIDKHLKVEREVVGKRTNGNHGGGAHTYDDDNFVWPKEFDVTKPATPEAEQYVGFGTQLKPSHETWWLARAPLAEKTIAENVLKHGCGAINIDASRVAGIVPQGVNSNGNGYQIAKNKQLSQPHDLGRFPANTLFSHTLLCERVGVKRVKGTAPRGKPSEGQTMSKPEGWGYKVNGSGIDYNDEEGLETVEAWECSPYCPIRLLDEQSGIRKSGGRSALAGEIRHSKNTYTGDNKRLEDFYMPPSEGGASRYFQCFQPTEDDYAPFLYTSKASRRERSLGCEALPLNDDTSHNLIASKWTIDPRHPNGGYPQSHSAPLQNNHPTVKPAYTLMRYLVTMITPPGGTVLDMFCGSGSTGVACVISGFNFIGIEQDASYCEIARARIAYHQSLMEEAA